MRALLALLLLLSLAGSASAHFHESWRVREHVVWVNQTAEDEISVAEHLTFTWHGEERTNRTVYALVMRTAQEARFARAGEAGGEATPPLLAFNPAAANLTLRPGEPLRLVATYRVVSPPGDVLAFSKAPIYSTDALRIVPSALPGFRAVPDGFEPNVTLEGLVGDGVGGRTYRVTFETDRLVPAPPALVLALIGPAIVALATRRK